MTNYWHVHLIHMYLKKIPLIFEIESRLFLNSFSTKKIELLCQEWQKNDPHYQAGSFQDPFR